MLHYNNYGKFNLVGVIEGADLFSSEKTVGLKKKKLAPFCFYFYFITHAHLTCMK